MTNINCLANCVYQKDGKCSFENVATKSISCNMNCAYFIAKEKPVVK